MLARIRSNWNSHTLLVGVKIHITTLENCLAVPKKVKKYIPYDPAILYIGM